jgi:hypothetical protein
MSWDLYFLQRLIWLNVKLWNNNVFLKCIWKLRWEFKKCNEKTVAKKVVLVAAVVMAQKDMRRCNLCIYIYMCTSYVQIRGVYTYTHMHTHTIWALGETDEHCTRWTTWLICYQVPVTIGTEMLVFDSYPHNNLSLLRGKSLRLVSLVGEWRMSVPYCCAYLKMSMQKCLQELINNEQTLPEPWMHPMRHAISLLSHSIP